MKNLINKKEQKAQQIKYDLFNTKVAYELEDRFVCQDIEKRKESRLSWNEICDLIETEHMYLQDWFLRGTDIKEVAGMLWLKGLTKRNLKQ